MAKEEFERWFVYFVNGEGDMFGQAMTLTATEVERFVQKMEMYEEEQNTEFHWGYKKYEN